MVLMGVIGALAIRGVQSQPANGTVGKILTFLQLDSYSIQIQVAVLGIFTAIVLIFRTIIGMYLTWKVLKFLSSRSAEISTHLLSRILRAGYLSLTKFNSSELQFILGPGVSALAVGVLGTASMVLSDLATLVIVSCGIMVIDPVIAIATILLFATVGLYLYFKLHKFSEEIGRKLTSESVESNKLISELIGGYRELYVRNRLKFYETQVSGTKYSISELLAKNSFIPNIGKYVIEISLVLGAALVAAAQFVLNDAVHAFASLGIFVAAGTRIAPALLRLQQGAIAIKSNIGVSHLTLDALREFSRIELREDLVNNPKTQPELFTASIEVRDLIFTYDGNPNQTLNIKELVIEPGSTVAIVGPSGSGKTTLVDLILGILSPQSGTVLLSGLSPQVAISKWPDAVAYVPQMPIMNEGSIRQNIAFGFSSEEVNSEKVQSALEASQLLEFVEQLPGKDYSLIGERGIGLSGGQLQRLGIARALYLTPKLIVLDEATSALDGITEKDISNAISRLKEDATIIIIAHRLSTIVDADIVIYIQEGEILARGSFEQVRMAVPNFDKQAKLMGL